MIQIRKSEDRGHATHGWLESRHTFSFANYHDPTHLEFRDLRVINEDWIEGGQGFGMHPHKDMEILTWMIAGALEHRDNMGNRHVVQAGEVQVMSAGTGILHSEHNANAEEQAHLLQIWIRPEREGIPPRYDQAAVSEADKRGRLFPVATAVNGDGAVKLHQDLSLYASRLEQGESVSHTLASGRYAWIQVISGGFTVNGQDVQTGDGLSFGDESQIDISASEAGELLLFDLN